MKLPEAARAIGMSEIAIGVMSESDDKSNEQNAKELRMYAATLRAGVYKDSGEQYGEAAIRWLDFANQCDRLAEIMEGEVTR